MRGKSRKQQKKRSLIRDDSTRNPQATGYRKKGKREKEKQDDNVRRRQGEGIYGQVDWVEEICSRFQYTGKL